MWVAANFGAATHICFRIAEANSEEDTVSMATQPIGDRFIPVEEYLSTGYEPDCEYEDGVVVERNLGEFEHSFLQAVLVTILTNNMETWGVFGLPEQRVQISSNHFLIPDVCVLQVGSPTEAILTRPPLIAIEILSPEDTRRRAAKKAAEYLQFGIEHVWVIDPHARVAYRGTTTELQLVPSGELAVPGTSILIRISDLFDKLDMIRAKGQR
jgi:Uma2 family endonuclease